MASRIDVSIEHRGTSGDSSAPPAMRDPNTCPRCGSHYRDDELEATMRVCPHCGYYKGREVLSVETG